MPAQPIAPARLRISAIAGCAALTLGALTAVPAYAHDSLIASTPEADEVLAESPEEVVLEFSGSGLTTGDAITNEIRVLGTDEQDWASDDPAEVEGSTMRTDIPEPLPNGEYEVHYRVVYSDGHGEELSFGFEVDDPAAEEEDDDAQPAETEVAQDTAETVDPTTEEDDEAAETSTGDAQDTEDEVAEPEGDESDESAQWAGPLGWVALAAAVLGLAAVVGYAVRRRTRSKDSQQQ